MQKSRGTVILDVDDVLTDTNGKVIITYNNEHEDNKISRKDIVRFRYVECPNIKYKVTHYFERPGFFKDLEPAEGVVEGIKELVDNKYDIIFATATCIQGTRDRQEWIIKHFPFISERNICIISRKDIICGDWFLDDCTDNVVNNKCTNRIIKDAEWNTVKEYPESEGFKRVNNFKKFVELVLSKG